MEWTEKHNDIGQLIRMLRSNSAHIPVLIGFDGYVDTLYRVVKMRNPDGTPEYYRTIGDYGMRICNAGELSADIDLVRMRTGFGGNAPLMADAMAAFGDQTVLVGALGFPQLHPCFLSLNKNVEKLSFANPCTTIALEFNDGKIMMGDVENSSEINRQLMSDRIGAETLRKIIDKAQLIAVLNWSAHAGVREIAAKVANCSREDQVFFFDISDPASLSEEDLNRLLGSIRPIASHRQVVLGLNENEAGILMKKVFPDIGDAGNTRELAAVCGEPLRKRLNLKCLTIHAIAYAIGFDAEGAYTIEGFKVEDAKFTTGAGDHYNAAFCHAYIRKWPLSQCLAMAAASASYYVKHGISPSGEELANYIESFSL